MNRKPNQKEENPRLTVLTMFKLLSFVHHCILWLLSWSLRVVFRHCFILPSCCTINQNFAQALAQARGGGGVLPYIDYTGMCCWPGYGFQVFKFRTGYINQENNVGNRVYNYIKLINNLIQVAINFLERHMDTYRISVILFWAFQFRTGYQNQP